MDKIKKISFNWDIIIAYYSFEKLEKNNCRQITFKEIDDFFASLINIAEIKDISIHIYEKDTALLTDVINRYSDIFELTVFPNGSKGFVIKSNISCLDIYKRFISSISYNSLNLLVMAFENMY